MNVKSYIDRKILNGEKLFAVLLDPHDISIDSIGDWIRHAEEAHIDLILIGGSHVYNESTDELVGALKSECAIPCVLFPGNEKQLTKKADAVLLLNLISGRNPEYLIGKHVEAAMELKSSGLEIISTGYILIDGGKVTAVNYMTQTLPIPRHKNEIAISTAVAGEMIGMGMVYLEAGSGAQRPVPYSMIKEVKQNIKSPLIVGGGIRTPEMAKSCAEAGADIIVIGNRLEGNNSEMFDFSAAIHSVGNTVENG